MSENRAVSEKHMVYLDALTLYILKKLLFYSYSKDFWEIS